MNANAERTPFPDASFDVVFCDHGAMTFADPYLTVPEVARLLRPGGGFAFNIASPLIWLCWGDGDEPPEPELVRSYFGLRRETWESGRVPAAVRGVDPAVPLERVRGARPGRAPAAGRPRTTYPDFAPLDWARRWPARTSGSCGSSDDRPGRRAAPGSRPSRVRPGVAVVLAVLALAWSVVALPEVRGQEDPCPNVIVIVTDDQSDDSIPNPYEVMPYLQRRAVDPNDHWIVFENGYVNTPLCCPSRATMLTGRFSHHTGVRDNEDAQLFDETSTLATWLHDAGYHTAIR